MTPPPNKKEAGKPLWPVLAVVHSRWPDAAVAVPVSCDAPSDAGADNAFQQHAPTPGSAIGRYGDYDAVADDAKQ